MARPENEAKTPLGARLRLLRKSVGDPDRDTFAASLGVSKTTIAFYERGERTPDANVLAAYRDKTGVNINWLVTGKGEMFEAVQGATTPARPIELVPEIVGRLGSIVLNCHREADIRLPPDRIAIEVAHLYNELLRRVTDMADMDEITAVFPQLEVLLKKRLAQAASEPGTGKRSA